MKLFIILVVVAFAAICCALTAEEQWTEFKTKYNRTFDEEEDKTRFAIFKENLAYVEEHNAKFEKGESSYQVGINHFSDRKEDEKHVGKILVPLPGGRSPVGK